MFYDSMWKVDDSIKSFDGRERRGDWNYKYWHRWQRFSTPLSSALFFLPSNISLDGLIASPSMFSLAHWRASGQKYPLRFDQYLRSSKHEIFSLPRSPFLVPLILPPLRALFEYLVCHYLTFQIIISDTRKVIFAEKRTQRWQIFGVNHRKADKDS